MTEFRRASGAVEAVVKLVDELAGSNLGATGDAAPSADARAKFAELQRHLAELAPTEEKMRRRCQARAELEELKAQLRERLPGAPEDSVKAAQDIVDSGSEGADSLRPLLDKALELEGIASYGAKMVEKVLELLGNLDVARARLQAEVVPHLAAAVASANAEDAARLAALEREADAAAAAEAQRAEEERRQSVRALAAESAHKLQEQRQAEEEAEWKRVAEEQAQRSAAAAQAVEDELLQRAEAEGERRLAEVGPDAACGEALVAMLATPVGVYRDVVESLKGMVGGIAAEPSDTRLRLLRVANEDFQRCLGRRPGVWFFLRCVGFELRARDSLPGGIIAALGIPGGPPSERFLYLQEPDMLNAYEQWLPWHARIKSIAEVLQCLERLAFQRTAHLGRHGLDVAARTVLVESEVLQRWQSCGGG